MYENLSIEDFNTVITRIEKKEHEEFFESIRACVGRVFRLDKKVCEHFGRFFLGHYAHTRIY